MRLKSTLLLVLPLLASQIVAQIAEPPKTRHNLNVDSTYVDNTSNKAKVVFTHTVKIPGAHWTRLFFDKTNLPVGTKLRITGLKDNWTQFLDGVSLVDYHHASCFFNGDSIKVELLAGPKTKANRVLIIGVDAGTGSPVSTETICGPTDDRVRFNDKRVCRLSIGCTGWLYACDLMGSAGHCFSTTSRFSQIAHFNTGLSSSAGVPAAAHPDDQYATVATTVTRENAGVGKDWAICRLAKNSNTGKYAGQVQGWFNIGPVPAANTTMRITGHGTVSSPVSRTLNQAGKTHTGRLVSNSGTALRYTVDTTGGNSGSPVINASTNRVTGVHTHGGCTSTGGSNAGTRIDKANWVTARAALKSSNCSSCNPNLHSYYHPTSSATTGTCNVIPFGTTASSSTWRNQKYQTIIPTATLCRTSGTICDIAFAPCGSGVRHFDRIRIRMAEKTTGTLGTTFATNLQSNLVTVLDARNYDWHQTANTWNRIGFDRSYNYTSAKFIVVQIEVWGAGSRSTMANGHRRNSTVQRIFAFGWTTSAPATGSSGTAAANIQLVRDADDLHLFGVGCKGSNGKVPALTFSGNAKIGGTGYAVNLKNALPSANTFLVIGLPRWTPPVDLKIAGAPGCLWYVPDTFLLRTKCTSAGTASIKLTLPRTTPVCLRVWFQWAPFDRNANPLGLTFSNNGRLLTGR